MKFIVASQTDVGLVRKNNEDSYLVDEDLALFIVADGMGGYQKGEVASMITCQSMGDYLKKKSSENNTLTKTDYIESVHVANQDIRKKINETANLERMGSTVISLLIRQDCMLIANVGDSRAYRFRDKKLEQISVDHSLIQETKAAGIKKELAPQFKNIVTRAMGMKDVVEPDVYAEKSQDDDIFLLCSDGLHGFVTDEKIAEILSFGQDIEAQIKALIEAAKEGGGKDNITAILIHIEEAPVPRNKPLTDTFEIPLYRLNESPNTLLLNSLQWKILTFIFLFIGLFYYWYGFYL